MLWIRQTEISFCYRYTLVISNKFVLYNEDVFHFVFIKKYLKQWIVMLIWNRFIYYGKINLIRRSHSFTHFEKRNKSWESIGKKCHVLKTLETKRNNRQKDQHHISCLFSLFEIYNLIYSRHHYNNNIWPILGIQRYSVLSIIGSSVCHTFCYTEHRLID